MTAPAGALPNGLLSPDVSCRDGFLWRLHVERTVLSRMGAGAMSSDALAPAGWVLHGVLGAAQVYRGPDGAELVLVPQTGRVQLRVDPCTPRGMRAPVAARLAAEIFRALDPAALRPG